MKLRLRSLGHVLLIVLTVIIIGGVVWNTGRDLRQLHHSFATVQTEDVYLPEYVETKINELNEIVLRLGQYHDPADEGTFQGQSEDLQHWIRARQGLLSTPEQRDLMKQIGDRFEGYVSSSSELIHREDQTPILLSPATLHELTHSNAVPVLELCNQLEASERAEQVQFVKDSKEALTWIQELLIVVLVLLLALVVVGAVAIYTGVIGPLRVELVKSRALAMRNEKLAALGTLAAGVAHEIRNPLTAINVRLHSLKKSLVNNSSEQEDALVIGGEIQRLERIVQEFLQFARPRDPKFAVISADSLFGRVKTLFTAQLEKASIRLEIDSPPDVWVRVDPGQIEQVIINLIRNAAESIGHDGVITMRVRAGAARRAQSMVTIEVSDTGKGMPPDVLKRIFDPFFTTKEDGTGLGLGIASRIIEKHGGAIECRSEPQRGSTFTIWLPHAKPEQMNEPAT